jgi:hypothetical protein
MRSLKHCVLAVSLAAAGSSGLQAGALWWGLGAPIYYPPFYGPWVAPTTVYRPTAIVLPRFPGGRVVSYFGLARDYTYFSPFFPGYTIPWAWGFWDPPHDVTAETAIQYAEVFTGLDGDGNPIGLDGLDISKNEVIGNVTGTIYGGALFKTTFAELPSLVHPSVIPNILTAFADAPPDGTVWLSLHETPIYDVALATPEPASIATIAAGLLLVAARFRKARTLVR